MDEARRTAEASLARLGPERDRVSLHDAMIQRLTMGQRLVEADSASPARATVELAAALRLASELELSDPTNPKAVQDVARVRLGLGDAAYRLFDSQGALQEYERAEAAAGRAVELGKDSADAKELLVEAQWKAALAMSELDVARADEACGRLRSARSGLNQLRQLDAANTHYRELDDAIRDLMAKLCGGAE